MKELATALNAFQAELVTVSKDKANPFFKSKYAPLDEIMKASQPVLTKCGLSVVQLPTHIDGKPALQTIVLHTSGQSVEAISPLLLAKDDPQGQGSAITYMRRYAYAAALGIVIDEDDDGNRASGNRQTAQTPAQAAQQYTGKKSVGNPEAPATAKQKELVAKLLTERGVPKEDMPGHLVEVYGVMEPKAMTQEQASFVIDELIGQQRAQA